MVTDQGRKAEELARAWLRRRGFRILAVNWRGGGGEIDLVAREGRTLVFVEVKSRRVGAPLPPEAAFTARKRRRLRRAARAFLAVHRAPWPAVRFDLLALELTPAGAVATVRHFRDVG